MAKYVTVQGDTWDSVSLKLFKTEKLMHKLMEYNPLYRYTVIFPANCGLYYEDIKKDESVNFPKWRNRA